VFVFGVFTHLRRSQRFFDGYMPECYTKQMLTLLRPQLHGVSGDALLTYDSKRSRQH
jgi:hypothetical protein